jgi:hypothetical protein
LEFGHDRMVSHSPSKRCALSTAWPARTASKDSKTHSNARDMASEIKLLQICSIVSETLERARSGIAVPQSIFHIQFSAHPGAHGPHPGLLRGTKNENTRRL